MDNRKIESYQDLAVWQQSHEVVQKVYKACEKFRKNEQAHLAHMLRMTATQIPVNIALGFKKRGKDAKVHYYRTALTALDELGYCLLLSHDLGHFKNAAMLLEELENLEKRLKGLVRSVAGNN